MDPYRQAAPPQPKITTYVSQCANCGSERLSDLRKEIPGDLLVTAFASRSEPFQAVRVAHCDDCAAFWAVRSAEQRAAPGPLGAYLTFGHGPEHEYLCSVIWRSPKEVF
jgi:hypothetical protein